MAIAMSDERIALKDSFISISIDRSRLDVVGFIEEKDVAVEVSKM